MRKKYFLFYIEIAGNFQVIYFGNVIFFFLYVRIKNKMKTENPVESKWGLLNGT